jgi:DNA-binding XRE family transcriptional regulator
MSPEPDFKPTDTVPGSQERIEVLEARAAAGLPMNHPADQNSDDTRGLVLRPDRGNGKPVRVGVAKLTADAGPPPAEGQTLGIALWRLRRRAGLSVAEVAKRAGLKRRVVRDYEADRLEPSWSMVLKLCSILRVTVRVGGEEVKD